MSVQDVFTKIGIILSFADKVLDCIISLVNKIDTNLVHNK